VKVALDCNSILLQKSLEIFLVNYLCSKKQADIIVTDKPSLKDSKYFYISTKKEADLIKPFSKAELILALERRYNLQQIEPLADMVEKKDLKEKLDFSILERRIDQLTQEYKHNIIRAIKAFYE